MSQHSENSIQNERDAWARAEREQELAFKTLPLEQKWRAVADAGEILRLIDERAAARRNLAGKTAFLRKD